MLKYILIVLPVFWINTDGNKSAHLVEKWEVGTSTGMLGDYSKEEFEELKRNGVRYLELGSSVFRNKTDKEKEAWVRDFKQKADHAGIEVWSVHLPFSRSLDISTTNEEDRINTIQEHKNLMALLKPLNIQKFVIHPSAEPIEDAERPTRIKNSVASLKILTEEVQKYNAQLALEVLPRTCLANTSEEMLKIVDAVDNGLEVCFDSNHMLQEKPEEFVSKIGKLITTVHISDYDGADEKHWLPGRGVINWSNVISELVKIEFQGPFMYEVVRRDTDDPAPTIKDLSDTWQSLKSDYLDTLN